MATIVIKKRVPAKPAKNLLFKIRTEVCIEFGVVKRSDLRGPSRKQPLARARQVAYYLYYLLTPLSYTQIGRLMGGKDHQTVYHGCKKIAQMYKTDSLLRGRIKKIREKLAA